MVFARPPGGRFMQPSIDTILVCRGLVDALAGIQVKRLIDVGSGSGPSGIGIFFVVFFLKFAWDMFG